MKFSKSSIAAALVAKAMAQEFTPPLNSTPPLDGRSLSLRGRNLLERQSYDYCGSTSNYCIGLECCGFSIIFNCMSPGGECCASLSTYGYGLWCASGTTCVVRSGLVQCQSGSGGVSNIVSSGPSQPRTTTSDSDTSTPYYPGTTTTSSPSFGSTTRGGSDSEETDIIISSKKTKSKSKAWIAGAVVGPLLGIAVIAGVVFFLFVLKKKKKTDANNYANAAIINSNQPGGSQPPMASAPVPPPAPLSPNPDYKTPAYTQHYDIPTPIASPPPQWTPASPVPTAVSPAPVYAQHQFTNELHGQSAANAVSPMSTGNGGYGAPIHQPQPVYGHGEGLLSGGAQDSRAANTAELPTAPAAQVPRGGAQELHG